MRNAEIKVRQNAQYLSQLSSRVDELSTSVKLITEKNKNVDQMSYLKISHVSELEVLKKLLEKQSQKISQMEHHIQELKNYRIATESASKARNGLLFAIVKYGPIVSAILLSLVGIGVVLREMQP